MRELILKLNKERQITVLISSHILDELSRLATHYGFIDDGCLIKEISAEELERTCRKCLRLEVSDLRVFARVMEELEIEYCIISDTEVDVFAHMTPTKVILELAKKGCEVSSIHERDESLESYYVSLLGGATNE